MAAILGYGAVSSLGFGSARIAAALREGCDGIAPIRRFDPTGFPLAALVPERNAPVFGGAALCTELAIAAGREAWERAGLDGFSRDRIALVVGTSLGEPGVRVDDVTLAVAEALGVHGPRLTVSTACASSTNAIGLALDLLALDAADVVIAGGADVLTPLVHAGFGALGVLAEGKCAPFSEPPGTTLGEGAGFLVLGRSGHAALHVLGYGLSADAFHDTGPDPTGAGVVRGLRAALSHAGMSPDAVDYVNAHGTGTRANDPAEWRAIRHVLGVRAIAVPVSSSKSFLGHAQGAAGVLETIATLISLEDGCVPPTQRHVGARPNTPPDVVTGATARRARCEVALKASSGFGGANCAIVIARAPHDLQTQRRPIYLAGGAVVEPPGDLAGLAVDPRGLDLQTRCLTASVSRALADAQRALRGDARDRTGLVVGLVEASRESDAGLAASIAAHGYRGLSANLFARQVLNAAPGTCARLLGVRGPHSVLSAGAATGLVAFVYAAELLATRGDVDAIVAAGVDEAQGAAAGVLA
ncbi:MAG TPA: beta-ketoacyl-[acyl-carrier-protein] synthase family protein, partial [Kofleriaceae bacterium]|nr:beta-ketoacyl-[acyl-carrier-protein] synthase family protein [Kofleriaceae bacterium]